LALFFCASKKMFPSFLHAKALEAKED
jgi:hypothetical protein